MSDEKQEMIPDGNNAKGDMNTSTEEKDVDGSELDSSKVKFINANGGADAHVTIDDDASDNAFCGLTKEELMKYADDPYWVRVRWILMILFWVVWFGMLAAAIVIIILAPKCPPRPNLEWWQKSSMCQVVPASYQDTDGDGVGDLKGIEKHLDYLKNNNETSVWLSPVYESGMGDLGYDVIDHKAVSSHLGTMSDFDSLRSAMHRKGMKLVLDFVPNHTSRNHTWFEQSRQGADNEFSDFYVWYPAVPGSAPPNNWLSVYGGSAWTYDDSREAFYLHQFMEDQPDLNLWNQRVQEELEAVLTFWLDKGVDGFRVYGAAHLFENNQTANDEPASGKGEADSHESLEHTLTMFQPETYAQMVKWRAVLDKYTETGYRFMMVDAVGTVNQTAGMFEYNDKKGADMALNLKLTELSSGCDSNCVRDLVSDWINALPEGSWGNSQTGNHDTSRVSTRLGDAYINAANMLSLLLPGTAMPYYGEEIGMVDGTISWEQTRDILAKNAGEADYVSVTRDPQRTPMQWSNNEENAGFTTADNPWLPVNADYHTKNVEMELAQGNSGSALKIFRGLSRLRSEPSIQWGTYEDTQDASQKIFGFVRQAQGFEGYLVAVNFHSAPGTADFHAAHPDLVPRKGKVAAHTMSAHRQNEFPVGQEMQLDDIYLEAGEGVVFKWGWDEAPTKK